MNLVTMALLLLAYSVLGIHQQLAHTARAPSSSSIRSSWPRSAMYFKHVDQDYSTASARQWGGTD